MNTNLQHSKIFRFSQLSSGFEIENPDHEIMIPLNVFDTVAIISQPIPCPGKLCSCSIWSIQVTEQLVCHLKGVEPVSQWARPVRAFFWSPPPFWAAPQNLHHSCCGPDKWRESTHFFVLHPQLRQSSNTTTTDLVSKRGGGGLGT